MRVRLRSDKAPIDVYSATSASWPVYQCIRLVMEQQKLWFLLRIYNWMATATANVMQGIAEGTPAQGTPLICDVRDVARAHVLAAEIPSASGRYIVSHRAPITATALSEALQVELCGPPQPALPP